MGAGRADDASALLEQLVVSAIAEGRLAAAGRSYWRLAMQSLATVHAEPSALSADDKRAIKRFSVQLAKAEVLAALHNGASPQGLGFIHASQMTADECREQVAAYIRNGATCPILYPLGDDVHAMIDAFSNWTP